MFLFLSRGRRHAHASVLREGQRKWKKKKKGFSRFAKFFKMLSQEWLEETLWAMMKRRNENARKRKRVLILKA